MSSCRALVCSVGILLLSPGWAQGQQPAAPPPSRQAGPGQRGANGPPAADVPSLMFAADAGIVIFTVKSEGAADFEAFFAKVKDALAKSANPAAKTMAAGWTLFRVDDLTQAGQVLYASVMDPVMKGADYDPVKLLTSEAPSDAAALGPKLKDAIVSVNRLGLTSVMKMAE